MNCPQCNSKTRVIETTSDGKHVYRSRKCVVCEYIFTTTECRSADSCALRKLRRERAQEIKHGRQN